MVDGKKSIAQAIVYDAIEKLSKNLKMDDALQAFEEALENAKPTLEVKSRRIGGATYQVPVEIPPKRCVSMAMKWIIGNARGKAGKSMVEGLSLELTQCHKNEGSTIKKKEDTHRMAEANRAFAHYRW